MKVVVGCAPQQALLRRFQLAFGCSKFLILIGGRGGNRTYNLSVKSRRSRPGVPFFSMEYEDNLVQNGALSALVWTKFWTKPPLADDLTENPNSARFLLPDRG